MQIICFLFCQCCVESTAELCRDLFYLHHINKSKWEKSVCKGFDKVHNTAASFF